MYSYEINKYLTTLIFINFFIYILYLILWFYCWGLWGNKILVRKTYVKSYVSYVREKEKHLCRWELLLSISSFIFHVFVLVCSFSVLSFALYSTAYMTEMLARNAGTYQLFGFHGARTISSEGPHCAMGTIFRSSFSRHPWHTRTRLGGESGVSRGWIGTRHEYKFIVPLNLWFATMVGTGCLGMPLNGLPASVLHTTTILDGPWEDSTYGPSRRPAQGRSMPDLESAPRASSTDTYRGLLRECGMSYTGPPARRSYRENRL